MLVNQQQGAFRWRSAASSVDTSAMSSVVSSRLPSRASSPVGRQVFRFFDLPSELRIRIYEEVLCVGKPLDLDPTNYRTILPRLNLFLVSRLMHEEAYCVFYSQPMQLFPAQHRFLYAKKPLLARIPPTYRAEVITAEMRLGPGWTAPPGNQNTDDSLGLRDCTSLRKLKILVELDPSDDIFTGFRGKGNNEHTYKMFCVGLLHGIFEQVPSLTTVEIDAYPAVNKDSPLVAGLRRKIEEHNKKLVWGPLRGWEKETDEPGMIGLEDAMGTMAIYDTPKLRL